MKTITKTIFTLLLLTLYAVPSNAQITIENISKKKFSDETSIEESIMKNGNSETKYIEISFQNAKYDYISDHGAIRFYDSTSVKEFLSDLNQIIDFVDSKNDNKTMSFTKKNYLIYKGESVSFILIEDKDRKYFSLENSELKSFYKHLSSLKYPVNDYGLKSNKSSSDTLSAESGETSKFAIEEVSLKATNSWVLSSGDTANYIGIFYMPKGANRSGAISLFDQKSLEVLISDLEKLLLFMEWGNESKSFAIDHSGAYSIRGKQPSEVCALIDKDFRSVELSKQNVRNLLEWLKQQSII